MNGEKSIRKYFICTCALWNIITLHTAYHIIIDDLHTHIHTLTLVRFIRSFVHVARWGALRMNGESTIGRIMFVPTETTKRAHARCAHVILSHVMLKCVCACVRACVGWSGVCYAYIIPCDASAIVARQKRNSTLPDSRLVSRICTSSGAKRRDAVSKMPECGARSLRESQLYISHVAPMCA